MPFNYKKVVIAHGGMKCTMSTNGISLDGNARIYQHPDGIIIEGLIMIPIEKIDDLLSQDEDGSNFRESIRELWKKCLESEKKSK